jgi:hypothetical protein
MIVRVGGMNLPTIGKDMPKGGDGESERGVVDCNREFSLLLLVCVSLLFTVDSSKAFLGIPKGGDVVKAERRGIL